MSYPKGTIKNNQLYIRCSHCGDSDRRDNIAHLSINLSNGLCYCFRCSYKGKLTTQEFIQILSEYSIDIDSTEYICEPMRDVLRGVDYESSMLGRDSRYSLLERHTDSYGTIRTPMRDIQGNITGYQYRSKDKVIVTEGIKGYGYIGDKLVNANTIRIVEGIYDVVYPNDVCVFGSINYSMLKPLYLYRMVLAPDWDIVHSRVKLQRFINMLNKLAGYQIEHIEVFRKDIDPAIAYEQGIRGTLYTKEDFIQKAKSKLCN